MRFLRSPNGPLVIAVLVAAAIRLDNISQPFVDVYAWREASVSMMAENFHHRSWNIFYPEVSWVGPGPGYQGREFQTVSYLAALAYTVLGHHDWIGRAISVAFGLLGVVALFQLVQLVWDRRRATAAAFILALSPEAARLDRTFTPDSAMTALVVTSFWLLIRHLKTERLGDLLVATCFGTLGNLTKIPGMIVGLPMLYASVAILRQERRATARRVRWLLAAAILSAIPVIAYYLWARHLSHVYPPYHFSGEGNWVWDQGLRAWIDQWYFIPRVVPQLWSMWTGPVLVLAAIGFAIPLIKHQAKSSEGDAPWTFHWWVMAGGVYYAIGALELVENGSNLQIFSPAVAALAASGVVALATSVAQRVRRPGLALPAMILVVGGIGTSARPYARMREAYAEQSYALGIALRHVSQEGDLVVTLGNLIGCPAAISYSGRRGWLFPPFEETADWNELPDEKESIRLIENLRIKGAKWFGVVASRRDEIWKHRPGFGAHLDRTADKMAESGDFVIYRLHSPPVGSPLATGRKD